MTEVKVQSLVWRAARVSDKWPREVAESIFGNYEALQWSDGSFGGSTPSEGINKEFSCQSIETAKELCQADFDARIRSALAS